MIPDFTPAHEYAEIFSLHNDEGMIELSRRIEKNGLREPCVMLNGKILDGRRRERACHRAGITPTYREFGSRKTDGDDPLEFVIDLNLHRRHLGEGERILAAAKYATAKAGGDRKKPFPQNAGMVPTVAAAAEKFDVSESKVERGKVVVANGTPALQEAVADGTIAVSDAAKVAKEPAKVQDKAVKKVKKGKAKSATKAAEEVKKESTDEPWVDGWGIPITKAAAAAFKNADKYDELLKLLKQAKKLYKELADIPGGETLQVGFISLNTTTGFRHKGLETCIMNVSDCKPKYTVCPYEYHEHAPHDKDCTLCRGRGWLGEVSKTNGPPESLIEAAKKAHGVTVDV